MSKHERIPSRYHKIDGWRGYTIPGRAVAGASDTGDCSDSPCPSDEVAAEIERFRAECLRKNRIPSRIVNGESSNVFCAKRWVVVPAEHFDRATKLALQWLHDHKLDTRYIHNAEA